MPTETSIELVALRRAFAAHVAVDSIDLTIRKGEFFSLIGPSGCGKTTTLRMLAGLELPTSGQILLGGEDVAATPAWRRNVHTVFQNYGLFPHLDVAGNVAFGLREKKVSKHDTRAKVAEILELVGLQDKASMKPTALSGGMQQRVALARALVLEPEVLLLDEPLGALDLKLRRQMQTLLKRVQREVGITFVYVTHDQEEAFSMSDRVGIMSGGRIMQVGSPDEVYYRPANGFVATFVGSSNLFPGVINAVESRGRYVVETPHLGKLTLSGAPDLAPTDPVTLLARPEFVVPAGADETDVSLGVTGIVSSYSFLGNHSRLSVALDDGTQVHADLFGALAASQYAPGDRVRLTVRPEQLWVLPAGHTAEVREEIAA